MQKSKRGKYLFFTFLLFTFCFTSFAQHNTDNAFRKPLKEVLNDIQKKYGVTIKYADTMVTNKWVNYADWRYRNDVEVTLDNVLSPLDMKVKKEKDKVYKLSYYEYYRWNPEEGWAELDRIASQYKTVEEWEKRKADLKPCLLEALQLTRLPASPGTAPIK
ncbi:MAG: acetylxylan esterase, partial [Chitinophagaceae bacterium]|nr:acetylxylan esterase [Chitinophagaceae bacterium]